MNYRKKPFDRIDRAVVAFMEHTGHRLERWLLGSLFIWFGALKIFGETSASSIIAKSVYWIEPTTVVPVLGVWEMVIGACLLVPGVQRIAIGLLLIRMPGTLLALVYHWDTCFNDVIWTPTIQGQYLIKELTLLGAALVIGGTVRSESST